MFCPTDRLSRYLRLVPFAAESFTRDTSGGCRTRRIPQAVPLVMSRRLIREARNEGVLLPERAKISSPVSLSLFLRSGISVPGCFLIRDPSSGILRARRALSLSLFLGNSSGCGLFSLSLLLLLNHLHRRRRFIIAYANVTRHCHKTRLINPSRFIRHSIKFGD